jgi:hypothetical protein
MDNDSERNLSYFCPGEVIPLELLLKVFEESTDDDDPLLIGYSYKINEKT